MSRSQAIERVERDVSLWWRSLTWSTTSGVSTVLSAVFIDSVSSSMLPMRKNLSTIDSIVSLLGFGWFLFLVEKALKVLAILSPRR